MAPFALSPRLGSGGEMGPPVKPEGDGCERGAPHPS